MPVRIARGQACAGDHEAGAPGETVDRLVNPGAGGAELPALYDAVAASVTN